MILAARHTVTWSWTQSLESTTALAPETGATSALNFITQRLLINWRAALSYSILQNAKYCSSDPANIHVKLVLGKVMVTMHNRLQDDIAGDTKCLNYYNL